MNFMKGLYNNYIVISLVISEFNKQYNRTVSFILLLLL